MRHRKHLDKIEQHKAERRKVERREVVEYGILGGGLFRIRVIKLQRRNNPQNLFEQAQGRLL